MATIVALLIVGAILLLAETVLPGLIAGIAGFICIIAAVVLGYMRFDLSTANTILGIAIAGLITGTMAYLRYFPTSSVAQRFVSKGAVGEIGTENPSLLHKTGETLTALRPSGKALIAGQRCDVITEGAFIESGQSIQVVSIEGLRVVVRPVQA